LANPLTYLVVGGRSVYRLRWRGPVTSSSGEKIGSKLTYLGVSRSHAVARRAAKELMQAAGPQFELEGETRVVVPSLRASPSVGGMFRPGLPPGSPWSGGCGDRSRPLDGRARFGRRARAAPPGKRWLCGEPGLWSADAIPREAFSGSRFDCPARTLAIRGPQRRSGPASIRSSRKISSTSQRAA